MTWHTRSVLRKALLLVLVVAVAPFVEPAPAHAWTPLAQASIHPGVQTVTGNAQCTTNFVFRHGGDVLIGQAAHCAGTGPANETDGCIAKTRGLGIPVQIDGATRPGTLVYSSWITMQARRETNPGLCRYNDFALVRVDPADHVRINPSVPSWGGPTGVATDAPPLRAQLYAYGNSGLRFGLTTLSPKIGHSVGTLGDGRAHTVYTGSPGVPGDSGAALMKANGKALGVLSTVALTPLPLSNNYTDLAKAMDYARATSLPQLQLVPGTKPFNGRAGRIVGR